MKQQQSITSLPLSPEQERHRRMVKYMIAMGIRVVCLVLMLFVQGWWLVVVATGAIVLPYFAMILANVSSSPPSGQVLRPGSVELYRPAEGPAGTSSPDGRG